MVFLFIAITIVVISIMLFLSKIQIEIRNFRFNSQTKNYVHQDYEMIIRLWFFKTRITKTKLEKLKKIDFSTLKKMPSLNKDLLKEMKKLDIEIKKFFLQMDIGTESASLTSIIVPAISTIIAIILKKKMKKFENQTFIISPVYQNQNLVKIDFSGIFAIKMSHIINIIYHLIKKEKKGVKEYERTSNRGAYDYSYE